MQTRLRAALVAALIVAASPLLQTANAQSTTGESTATAGGGVADLSPVFSGSKAGVFVLAFSAPGADGGAALQGLGELTATHAGIVAAVVGGAASGTVAAIEDPTGAIAKRFSASQGEIVAVDRAGTEIARFPSGTPLGTIGDRIEKSRAAPTREYNIPSKTALALEGYDPTSYFDAPKPAKGDAKVTTRYRGVVYRFISAQTREKFNADPEKYVPTYGGWCATAMAEGDKVEVDPTNYKVTRGRLFLFYKGFLGNARNDWEKNEDALEKKADGSWAKIAK